MDYSQKNHETPYHPDRSFNCGFGFYAFALLYFLIMTYVDVSFRVSDNSDFHYLIQEDADALQLVELSYVENGRETVRMTMTSEIARTVAQKLLDMADILDEK